MTKRRVACSLAFVMSAACGLPSEEPDPAASSPTGEPKLRLVEVADIGCAGCDGLEQLSVRFVSVDSDANVYVLNRFEPFVRVFGPTGAAVAAFGKFGDGPRELRNPSSLHASDAGVLVLDGRARRLVLYDLSGEPAREWFFPIFPWAPIYDAPRSRLLFVSPHEATRQNESGIYAFDLGTETVSSVVVFGDNLPRGSGGSATRFYPIAVSDDRRVAVGEHDRYSIRLFDPQGSLITEHAREIGRVPKTAVELELEEHRAAAERFAYTPDPVKLHYYNWALEFDDEGRLWVLAGRSNQQETLFDVFDSGGYLGSVTAPGGIAERHRYEIRGQHLVAPYLDESGEYVVRLFRIEEAS